MNEKVKKVLEEQMWYVATFDDEANVVPIGFHAVLGDGKLALGDVFMNITKKNIEKNGKVAISVCDPATMESYQIKGKAEYVSEGPLVDMFQKMAEAAFKGALKAKGAVTVTPEKVIISTPGPDNNKIL